MKDPRDVVKPGDVVQVRVVEVDAGRKRIARNMKSGGATVSHFEKRYSQQKAVGIEISLFRIALRPRPSILR